MENTINFENLVRYMYKPKDPASLGIVRFLFGLLMLFDISEERGGSEIDLRWGQPRDCHFPLFSILPQLDYSYIALLYGIMTLGAFGIMIGYKFKLSALLFGIPYWYILLLDKSYWNNHSYLYGIVAILLMCTSADNYFSLDGFLDDTKRNREIPNWNYFILKFQFFTLYFLAGLKKSDVEWLEGYSMSSLSSHWVFSPFKLLLSDEAIDFLIVHWFGFFLDLTIGFWLLIDITRPVALVVCALFHLMNSRLFSIGMFPYVCLATLPLFCNENWPRRIFTRLNSNKSAIKNSYKSEIKLRHKICVGLLLSHCCLQAFLPFSHFITKGYNNWTNGLYGYSWDMMIHSWDTVLVVVKVIDNKSKKEMFIDPRAYTQNDRWNKHADMCLQYAQCLQQNLQNNDKAQDISSNNLSIYIDVWCSLNSRFQQRMFNPNYDLLKATWSPFKNTEWLLPLLTQYNNLRIKMREIIKQVYSWSNYSDVLFIADFPGLFLDNFISEELTNVSLTVLQGEIFYEIASDNVGVKLKENESVLVDVGVFHRIYTISDEAACYMYIYENKSRDSIEEIYYNRGYSPFPVFENMGDRVEGFVRMIEIVLNAFMHVFYGEPLVRRNRTINML